MRVQQSVYRTIKKGVKPIEIVHSAVPFDGYYTLKVDGVAQVKTKDLALLEEVEEHFWARTAGWSQPR